ncbi:MAG: hypothetical protein GF364_08915 [Candidatus Lokiarchaeota archaeon]|nr:hypothetical protein [Candidatus Lokiarchaeota archaeon]
MSNFRGFLIVYDIQGIQNFIFATNKLSQNVGGSYIVHSLFQDKLPKIVESIARKEGINSIDLEDPNKDAIHSLKDVNTEIISIISKSGGNAFLYLRTSDNKKIYELITANLWIKGFKMSLGRLKFATASILSTDNFVEDFHKLILKLNLEKSNNYISQPLLGIGITQLSNSTQLPASKYQEDEDVYISLPEYKKENSARSANEYYEDLLPEKYRETYTFPMDLDQFGQKPGFKYIAVVHIDGDGIGKAVRNFIKEQSSTTYFNALLNFGSFSKNLRHYYQKATQGTIKDLCEKIEGENSNLDNEDSNNNGEFHLFNQNNKQCLPFRPLILSGDDITFITHGKLGIYLVERFFKNLMNQPFKPNKVESMPLSACAGILIVKSHFPFNKAYSLTEQICKNAKLKSRIMKENYNLTNNLYWFDFQIIQSNDPLSLQKYRETQYNLGISPESRLEPLKSQNYSIPLFKLLWRPFYLVKDTQEMNNNNDISEEVQLYSWREYKTKLKILLDSKKFTKTKLNQIKHSLATSKADALYTAELLKLRGVELPKFASIKELFNDKGQTPYYDLFELEKIYYRGGLQE